MGQRFSSLPRRSYCSRRCRRHDVALDHAIVGKRPQSGALCPLAQRSAKGVGSHQQAAGEESSLLSGATCVPALKPPPQRQLRGQSQNASEGENADPGAAPSTECKNGCSVGAPSPVGDAKIERTRKMDLGSIHWPELHDWGQLCLQYGDQIRCDVLPASHPDSSKRTQSKAILGDKLLDVHLIMHLYQFDTSAVTRNQHPGDPVSATEYSTRRSWVLSNSNMNFHARRLLVPYVLSDGEWAKLDYGTHSGGTAVEAAVGALYLMEGSETERFKNAVRNVLCVLLLGTAHNQLNPMDARQLLAQAEGVVTAYQDKLEGWTDRQRVWSASAQLEGVSTGPIGPYGTRKEAESAASQVLLYLLREQESPASDQPSKAPVSQDDEPDTLPQPKRVELGTQALQPRSYAVGKFKPLLCINEKVAVIHVTPGESMDDWLLRHIAQASTQERLKKVIPHMQIAAASGQSKIMKTLHCWRACLRPAVNGSQRPAMHTCVVHLVLAKSDKDVVLIGQGSSPKNARCDAGSQIQTFFESEGLFTSA